MISVSIFTSTWVAILCLGSNEFSVFPIARIRLYSHIYEITLLMSWSSLLWAPKTSHAAITPAMPSITYGSCENFIGVSSRTRRFRGRNRPVRCSSFYFLFALRRRYHKSCLVDNLLSVVDTKTYETFSLASRKDDVPSRRIMGITSRARGLHFFTLQRSPHIAYRLLCSYKAILPVEEASSIFNTFPQSAFQHILD